MSTQQAAVNQPIIIVNSQGPGFIVRVLWFLFIGWWLAFFATVLAWLCLVTIILLPIGLMIINRMPSIVTLRPRRTDWRFQNGVLIQGATKQYPLWIRALYFLVVGWWLSAAWLTIAYFCVLPIISLILWPLAFWMYGRAGAVTTLFRS
jgi:uncharacterized membrane protein YccF (DUF307 family)